MTDELLGTYSTVEYLDNLYRKTESEYAFKAKALGQWKNWTDSFQGRINKSYGNRSFINKM